VWLSRLPTDGFSPFGPLLDVQHGFLQELTFRVGFVGVGKVALGARRLHPVGEERQSKPDGLAQDDRLFFPGQTDDMRQFVSGFFVQLNSGSHGASSYTTWAQMPSTQIKKRKLGKAHKSKAEIGKAHKSKAEIGKAES